MRTTTTLEYAKLVRYVETSLAKLNYSYLKNQADRITEFEVESPCHFRILVQDETRERFSFALLRSEKNESAIEILRTLGAGDSKEVLKKHILAFVEQLREALPQEPWKGFGLVRSRSEKVKWSELAELPEA